MSHEIKPHFGFELFDNHTDIQRQLEKNTPVDVIKAMEDNENNRIISYVPWWTIVEMANNIFGDDGWSNYITSFSIDSIEYENGQFEVTSSAQVKIELKDGTSHEDIGVATSYDKDRGVACQMSKKMAIGDGIKRAFRLFGNNLGNNLERKRNISNKENTKSISLLSKKENETKPKRTQPTPLVIVRRKK
ncbi:hypothetical protein ENUP19_0146G0039 [Entamoeba nuttalli]|uniref:Rad52/22 family double-strand break repair protein, putative n=2 Tax=Entamoeba nuttalli TaxID=412467 RepID=K2H7C2_ENTNP|nr:Rad52/22 family double-strand break repair protein, putative [Entamoeba nuttalli P19]EKE38424.1 Rad52/22 family double-strand break repair protein, putative [Entamoeba nuttalli P19]|eukprot:XP_008859240.1 Rad52/22 family double-strand break repair protein, putative [Entamoeba nuttalli P19]